MLDWHDRLRQTWEHTGWTAVELARRAGVTEANVYKYLDGRVKQPRGKIPEALAAALGVRLLWLRDGEGPKYIDGKTHDNPNEELRQFADAITPDQARQSLAALKAFFPVEFAVRDAEDTKEGNESPKPTVRNSAALPTGSRKRRAPARSQSA